MKRTCEICGEIHDEVWMMSYNSGRSTHWFCWSCWKLGQGEAASNEVRRRRQQCKEANKKK